MSARTARTAKPAASTKATAKPAPAPVEAPAAPAQPANCRCGCGAPTVTARALFLSGHDARFAGDLGRRLAASEVGPEREALTAEVDALSPALKAKVLKIAETANRKAAEKAAKAAARAAAKAAYEAALAR